MSALGELTRDLGADAGRCAGDQCDGGGGGFWQAQLDLSFPRKGLDGQELIGLRGFVGLIVPPNGGISRTTLYPLGGSCVR